MAATLILACFLVACATADYYPLSGNWNGAGFFSPSENHGTAGTLPPTHAPVVMTGSFIEDISGTNGLSIVRTNYLGNPTCQNPGRGVEAFYYQASSGSCFLLGGGQSAALLCTENQVQYFVWNTTTCSGELAQDVLNQTQGVCTTHPWGDPTVSTTGSTVKCGHSLPTPPKGVFAVLSFASLENCTAPNKAAHATFLSYGPADSCFISGLSGHAVLDSCNSTHATTSRYANTSCQGTPSSSASLQLNVCVPSSHPIYATCDSCGKKGQGVTASLIETSRFPKSTLPLSSHMSKAKRLAKQRASSLNPTLP